MASTALMERDALDDALEPVHGLGAVSTAGYNAAHEVLKKWPCPEVTAGSNLSSIIS